MKHITFFTGNRAEFGIMFPIIVELSQSYYIDIIFSGAHVLPKWNTYEDSIKQLDDLGVRYTAHRIELPCNDDIYTESLGYIYSSTLYYFIHNKVDYAFVLGDRIESFAFALGAFYSRIPIFHICGGDVVQVANYDTNVRHSMTKLANYHFVTNELSRDVVLQLGEEDDRVINVGNPSFDYERMGFLTDKDMLIQQYDLEPDTMIGILTFHPSVGKSAKDNFSDFVIVYEGCMGSALPKLFVTYPNNDQGYDLIVDYLEKLKDTSKVKVIKSFGTLNYLGIMNAFKTVILGNSSSGLLETLYYQVPVINIGNRQNDRIHGSNVIQCSIDCKEISEKIDDVVANYDRLRTSYEHERFLFGDGKASIRIKDFMHEIDHLSREEQLFKQFIIRK